jgi:hypothetical protein
MGLLVGPLRLFDVAQGDKSADPAPLIVFHIFTLLCCVTGGIGMCGGFKQGKWKARVGGVAVGLILWVFEVSIVLFIGCCLGLSHM